jgi:L-2-hydroxyglutarate oxidase LhgO
MEKVNVTIIGAGVIGLAVARELSGIYKDILIIEKNPSFGQETSSRNSEVIHCGIYYPKTSLKTKTCVEGRELLYAFCKSNNIAYRKTEKLIVAIDETERDSLNSLYRCGLENGISDLRVLSEQEIKTIEPNIKACAAIYSPSTGILDSHAFMKTLLLHFQKQNGMTAYNTELIGVDKVTGGYELTVKEKTDETFKFFSRIVINCAGLNSDKIAWMAGIRHKDYKINYCKGDYFRAGNNKARFISRLIYPVPKENRAGLGIHATLDLAGGLRLGPDDEYVERIEYNVDITKQSIFYQSACRFLPFLELQDLSPDTAGIRPKLQGHNEGFRDFIIKDEADNGLERFINLIGIESPGLTGALSIARMVKELTRAAL